MYFGSPELHFEPRVLDFAGGEIHFARLEMHFEGLELNFERLERYLELLQRHFGRSEAVLTRQMSSLEGVFRVWEGLPNLVTPATFVGRRSGAAPRPPHLRPLLPSANPSHLLLGSRLPVEGREEDGQEPGRLGMPPGRDGPVPGVEGFPLPEHGDRPRLARHRLELPGAGQLSLGSGDHLVLLAQTGQVGGGESVGEGGNGRTGTMVRAAHERYLLRG